MLYIMFVKMFIHVITECLQILQSINKLTAAVTLPVCVLNAYAYINTNDEAYGVDVCA